MQISRKSLLALVACLVASPVVYLALSNFHDWYLKHPNGHVFALCATVLLCGITLLLVTQGDDDGSFW